MERRLYFHLLVFILAFWPGSFFAAAALPFLWARRKSWQIQYLLCWMIPHWVVFELIATKLPHYTANISSYSAFYWRGIVLFRR